jgi:hypothetical protein
VECAQAAPALGISREPAIKDQRFQIDAGIRQQRREGNVESTAGRGGALQLEPVDGREKSFAIRGRRLDKFCSPAESDEAHQSIGRTLFDECLGCGLGGGYPIRINIGCTHAQRDVNGEDNGLPQRRQRDGGTGTGDRDNRCDQAQQEQKRRDVPPESVARAHRLPYQA